MSASQPGRLGQHRRLFLRRVGQPRRLSPRREVAAVLVLGLVGAGLVFVAVHQVWADVRTAAPRPLPGSNVRVSGQDLLPAAGGLAVAALASLAAVLATRGLIRRLVGLVLAGFGVGIAVAVSLGVTAADAIAAVAASAGAGSAGSQGSAGSAANAGSVTAGSATAGSAQGGSAPAIAGFPAHVVMTSLPWRPLALAGAAALVAAGLLVAWRATTWPVMSSRFDPPERARSRQVAPAARGAAAGGDTATIWESLSRGEDPTDAGPGERERMKAAGHEVSRD